MGVILNDNLVTGAVSRIVVIVSLYRNFNLEVTRLVTMATHLNSINADSGRQGGGVRWRRKISEFF